MTSETEFELYQQIVGQQLSAVVFVMDYIQFQFNPPPTITIFTRIIVQTSEVHFTQGDDQFRNKLCEQITKIVKFIEVNREDVFKIVFQDDSEISISLHPEDYVGPEALVFFGHNDRWSVI